MNQNPAHHVADVVDGLGVEILLAESSTDFLRIAQSLREAAKLCEQAAEEVFGQEGQPVENPIHRIASFLDSPFPEPPRA